MRASCPLLLLISPYLHKQHSAHMKTKETRREGEQAKGNSFSMFFVFFLICDLVFVFFLSSIHYVPLLVTYPRHCLRALEESRQAAFENILVKANVWNSAVG